MELLNSGPFKGEKLQFVGAVMGLSIGRTPTGIGDDGISPIIMSLVENSPHTRPTSIGVQFKKLKKNWHRAELVLWCTDASVHQMIIGTCCSR